MKDSDRALKELKQVRDQIRLKMHLAGMEAKQQWEELEPKLEEVERWFERGGERAATVMGTLVEELGAAFRRFRDRLEREDSSHPDR
jgi:HAMP domain-containing protein